MLTPGFGRRRILICKMLYSQLVLVSFALAWLVFLCVVWWRRWEFAREGRRRHQLAEEAEVARRRVLVASSRKRVNFEEQLVRFREVRVAFVRHSLLRVPDSVLPAGGEASVLAYGLDMAVPIPDLRTTLDGIHATLSFSRAPCRTFVPWEAVVGTRGYGELEPTRPKLELVP